jgi:predicted nucleic acid-binding Zn finger protein
MKRKTDDGIVQEIDDDKFDSITKQITVNRKNFENGKLKYMQWLGQDDYILEQHYVTKKDWLHALNKRAGVHNRSDKKVVTK